MSTRKWDVGDVRRTTVAVRWQKRRGSRQPRPSEEFATTVAYVSRLVEIVGNPMGLEGSRARGNFKSGRCFQRAGRVLAFQTDRQRRRLARQGSL
jgi:hypothetical protein